MFQVGALKETAFSADFELMLTAEVVGLQYLGECAEGSAGAAAEYSSMVKIAEVEGESATDSVATFSSPLASAGGCAAVAPLR